MADRDETAIAEALRRATYGDMRLVDDDDEVALIDPSRPGGRIVWYPVDDIARMLTDAGLRVVTEPPADLVEHVAKAMYSATIQPDAWHLIRDTKAPLARRTVEAYRVAARAAITAVQQHQGGGITDDQVQQILAELDKIAADQGSAFDDEDDEECCESSRDCHNSARLATVWRAQRIVRRVAGITPGGGASHG